MNLLYYDSDLEYNIFDFIIDMAIAIDSGSIEIIDNDERGIVKQFIGSLV